MEVKVQGRKDSFNLALSTWIYVSKIHPDNIGQKEAYQMFGDILTVIDVQLWGPWEKKFSFPASTWDWFKIKFFPQWLLERVGARIKTYSFSEVVPLLSRDIDKMWKQIRENTLGHYESVVRQPTTNYENYLPLP